MWLSSWRILIITTYYEIPTQLACAYLKGHLTGRALDWFEVLGYRVVEDKATDYAHSKQALSEQFPVENWRETRGNNRYSENNRTQREFNTFEGQGVADNRRIHGRRRGGQSDHRFHNQGGRQGASRNGVFRDQPGLTHVLYHEIDTGDQGPVVSRPYRYDRVKQKIIDYRIEKMLQEGPIRPIQSPYASPVVLKRKNNGLPPDSPEAYRFAIDYRKLNAMTKYPGYPLPVIDDLITNISHTSIMSTLDFQSGYFQLAISPKDIEKTAFITRNGIFAFLRMPFGLSGATPNFQKAIGIILKPVIERFVMVYMDDVTIASPSFNEHIDHLNQETSRQYGWITNFGAGLRALALNSREQFIREQRKDPELGHIYRYLENPDDGSVNATVCEGWSQNFKIIDGLLFYAKYSTTLGELRVYIPKYLREAIMQEFHDLLLAGHLGKRKTYLKLRDTCYFPYMRKYIFEYVSTCDRCQKFNYKNALPDGRLIPIVSNYPNEIVTLDLLGPYPASRSERYRLLLLITDHFTQWSELIPLRKASAQVIANALFKNYISRYGAPISLISDNGPNLYPRSLNT
ncbi:retrovirus-related Pol polyprotein from transposon 17.6 [Trichonephila clavipes]|nr:retrovirus-related Pol polyprotein from transposon 17.6 [Trichonephila clavipes]